MIRGLGRERGFQTLICMAILLVNMLIVLQAISTLGERNELGEFQFTAQIIPREYFVCMILSLLFGLGSMWFIKFPDPQARWGARLFCSLLIPAFLLLFTLNMKIFSWTAMLQTILS